MNTTIHSGRAEKKSRVVSLLELVLTTRIMLSMLRTMRLNDSDIVMLKQYHLQFAEKSNRGKKEIQRNRKRQREKQ